MGKLFISHAGSEQELAYALAEKLERLGHQTILYERDFDAHLDFVMQISKSLVAADYTICLLSTNFLSSNWCVKELQLSLNADKVLPVLLEDCDPRVIPQSFQYLDARQVDPTEVAALICQEMPWFLSQMKPLALDLDQMYRAMDVTKIVVPQFGTRFFAQRVTQQTATFISESLESENVVVEVVESFAHNSTQAWQLLAERRADIVFYGYQSEEGIRIGFVFARGWQLQATSEMLFPKRCEVEIERKNFQQIESVLKHAYALFQQSRGRDELASSLLAEAKSVKGIRAAKTVQGCSLWGEIANTLGILHYYKGNFIEAFKEFSDAIKANPTSPMPYSNRCAAAGKLGRYDTAISDGTQAIKLDPTLAVAYNNRGMAFFFNGDLDQGLTDLTEAVRLKNQYALYYANRAAIYMALQDTDQAEANLTNALLFTTSSSERSKYLLKRAEIYFHLQDFTAVVEDATKALEYRFATDAYALRGDAFFLLSRHQEAVDDLTKAIEAGASAALYRSRSKAYAALGKHTESLADRSKALSLEGKNTGLFLAVQRSTAAHKPKNQS